MVTTRDLGFAIRDFLEDKVANTFTKHGTMRPDTFKVEFIDISDAHNPEIHVTTESGDEHVFRVSIVSIGDR